ncbi:hypothetical protein ACNKHW_14615 [Shigella flexneri]
MNIRYLLCNADEMEPGTYKDRLLMEQLPHLLVEGMLISAFALKAYRGYIFLRGEYIERRKPASCHCRSDRSRSAGEKHPGNGFDFELFVHTGAGRYICGEETALINSLEGRRANPRSKPPFPASSGVWENRLVSITSKPCVTCRRFSRTAKSGTHRRKAKMPGPS